MPDPSLCMRITPQTRTWLGDCLDTKNLNAISVAYQLYSAKHETDEKKDDDNVHLIFETVRALPVNQPTN